MPVTALGVDGGDPDMLEVGGVVVVDFVRLGAIESVSYGMRNGMTDQSGV